MKEKQKIGVYAGSFDPWSDGHQFVLNASSELFDEVHVLCAVNPVKNLAKNGFTPTIRARVIAAAINPLEDYSQKIPPFKIKTLAGGTVIVAVTEGLVADYAKEIGSIHLVRGLRSTSDFEAEFSLYFSNKAINKSLQTWTVMCPPELLHCSSSFVKSAVGKVGLQYVGATFLAQATMLFEFLNLSQATTVVGEVFDLILHLSKYRFERQISELETSDLKAKMQIVFTELLQRISNSKLPILEKNLKELMQFRVKNSKKLRKELEEKKYPETEVNLLWDLLCSAIPLQKTWLEKQLAENISKTRVPLRAKK